MPRFYQTIALVHGVVLAFLEIFFSWVILTSKTYSELHASPEYASVLKFSLNPLPLSVQNIFLCCLLSVDGPDHNNYCRYICAMTSMTQPIYLETFVHVSPYFDNQLLSNGFITRKLVKGRIWNIFRAIFLTLRHATVISVRHDCR